ncbi:MAG: fasciclin domain-containing protein [Planctomycetota bacterium]
MSFLSRKIAGFSLCVAFTLLGATGCASTSSCDSCTSCSSSAKAEKDIIETAVGAENLSTLVAAIKAAGLVETLQSEGPFTVFAPTNDAFAKLPAGTVESLLKPENKDKLTAILLYHVHAGSGVLAKDVKTMSLPTANGQPLDIKVSDKGVTVDNAKVIATDIVASNGVVHLIDTVVLPE